MKLRSLIFTFLCALLFSTTGWAQVTIASDGLNNATTLFTLTNGAYYTGNSVAGDRPATSPFASEGTHSRGVINASATLLSNDINSTGYTSITMSLKLASFSIGSTGNGADGSDVVTIEVSPNGGTNWYSTERVLGNSNAFWAYSATGIATTAYDGNATPIDFTPAGGGSRTTDGYSNIEITNLPVSTNLKFRITLLNNAAAEQWVVDDFKVQGIVSCTAPTTQASAITTNGEALDGFNVNWTAGDGNGTMIVVSPSATATVPVNGTAYTANLAWGSAGQIDTNNRVVFRGAGTTSGTVTGLTAGTQYYVFAYEYNTVGNCYNTPRAIGFCVTKSVEPTAHAATFTCSTVSTTQINLAFPSRATIPNARAYIILQKIGSAPTGAPTDGAYFPVGTVIGDAVVAGNTALDGTETSFSVTGLTPGTNYYFSIIPYNSYLSVPSTINYYTGGTVPTTNCTTNSLSPPVITSSLTASGNQGSAFTYTITATNTPTSYNATGLPAGLSINSTTGVISGTPSVSGTFNVTITATNGIGSDNKTLVVTLGTGPCLSENFVVNALPSGWVQNAITFTTNYAEFGFNNGDLTTVSLSNPASLTFTLARTTNATLKDMIVEVSTTSQIAGFIALSTYDHGNTTSGGTTNCTVDLSAYTSFSNVYIRFRKSSSTTSPWRLDDIKVFCGIVCTPAVVTVTPTSGPVGTEVTITASSGSLTGASIFFGGISATILSNNGTQMVVVVPNGATTGAITITDSQPCDATTSFTVISKDNSSCEGAAFTSDLIIYDIHDEKTGSGGFITLYNGTASTVNLTNYSLYRTSNHDDLNEVPYGTLTGTIASGALGIIKVSPASCGPAATNGSIAGGFNENDGIQLRNAAGTVIIDDVDTYPTAPGYYMVRNSGALSARTSYVAADWSTIPLAAGVCYPSAGLTIPSGSVPPSVSVQPVSATTTCASSSAILTVTGTEGFVGGNSLAYQWYEAAPGATTWTAVSNGGVYSGATSNTLTISSASGLNNYQYYCQIRENSATCFTASIAVKINDSGSTTWNGTTWSNGVPTLTKSAIIDGTYITATNGNFSCCSVTVNATRSLTISSNGYVEVQNNITNNGAFIVLNSGSLVQISDSGVNTGNIQYNRTANLRKQDYVYWSSPVTGFASSAISPATNLGYQYKWLPITGGTNNFGNWTYANETMVLGKGYIVRGPDSFTNTLTNYTATFTGVPNNGVVTIPITRGTWVGGTYNTGVSSTLGTNEDDNWNLVGNPYPSAIHAINFLTLNPNIDGFVNIWTHGTLPSNAIADPFYNDYAYNYTASDYITYNASGASTGPSVFNGRIAGGQGFFVSMLDSSAATTENLIFNNSLRNIVHNNGQFYRNSNATTNTAVNSDYLERNRIWLDLVSSSGTSIRSMFGYIENATDGKDRLFDAFSNQKASFNIFSLIDEEQMVIQGKKLPFDTNDRVKIGVSIPQEGLYKIAISSLDGLFSNPNQNIYLEDKLLNVIYDLRTAPYSFMANKGILKDRFVIRYTNAALANETFNTSNDVVVISNQELSVVSTKEEITNVIVFDVLGRKLFESKNNKTHNLTLPISKRDAPLFIEISLENGTKINKKTVF